jgi:hypothetical protein
MDYTVLFYYFKELGLQYSIMQITKDEISFSSSESYNWKGNRFYLTFNHLTGKSEITDLRFEYFYHYFNENVKYDCIDLTKEPIRIIEDKIEFEDFNKLLLYLRDLEERHRQNKQLVK